MIQSPFTKSAWWFSQVHLYVKTMARYYGWQLSEQVAPSSRYKCYSLQYVAYCTKKAHTTCACTMLNTLHSYLLWGMQLRKITTCSSSHAYTSQSDLHIQIFKGYFLIHETTCYAKQVLANLVMMRKHLPKRILEYTVAAGFQHSYKVRYPVLIPMWHFMNHVACTSSMSTRLVFRSQRVWNQKLSGSISHCIRWVDEHRVWKLRLELLMLTNLRAHLMALFTDLHIQPLFLQKSRSALTWNSLQTPFPLGSEGSQKTDNNYTPNITALSPHALFVLSPHECCVMYNATNWVVGP